MIKKFKKIIIATGGTGGHIFPAVSLANHFLEQKINVEIVSDRRGLRYLENFRGLKITEINSLDSVLLFDPRRAKAYRHKIHSHI